MRNRIIDHYCAPWQNQEYPKEKLKYYCRWWSLKTPPQRRVREFKKLHSQDRILLLTTGNRHMAFRQKRKCMHTGHQKGLRSDIIMLTDATADAPRHWIAAWSVILLRIRGWLSVFSTLMKLPALEKQIPSYLLPSSRSLLAAVAAGTCGLGDSLPHATVEILAYRKIVYTRLDGFEKNQRSYFRRRRLFLNSSVTIQAGKLNMLIRLLWQCDFCSDSILAVYSFNESDTPPKGFLSTQSDHCPRDRLFFQTCCFLFVFLLACCFQ